MIQRVEQITAKEISALVKGELAGDPSLAISQVSSIDKDVTESLTFCSETKYEKYISGNGRRVIIVHKDIRIPRPDNVTYIVVKDVYIAMSHILSHLNEDATAERSISPQAMIDQGAGIEEEVSIGHFSIVNDGAVIGSSTIIKDNVSIAEHVAIGKDCVIHQGVRILKGVTIGDRVTIYPNAVIGGDGFGFAEDKGSYKKLPHIGSVIIEDDVEIGSNCCIDRGMIGDTIIRQGAKLDNLIHIAHGVEVGRHVAIAAQTGVSGSSTIGEYSQLGGQVGVIGHVSIAPGSKIQAQSGVAGSIKEANKKWYGYPSFEYFKYLRSFALFKRLPELLQRLRRLEEKLEDK